MSEQCPVRLVHLLAHLLAVHLIRLGGIDRNHAIRMTDRDVVVMDVGIRAAIFLEGEAQPGRVDRQPQHQQLVDQPSLGLLELAPALVVLGFRQRWDDLARRTGKTHVGIRHGKPVAANRAAAIAAVAETVPDLGLREHLQGDGIERNLPAAVPAAMIVKIDGPSAGTQQSLHDSSTGRNQVSTTAACVSPSRFCRVSISRLTPAPSRSSGNGEGSTFSVRCSALIR